MNIDGKVHRVDWRADNFLVGTSMMEPNEGWLYTVIINLIYSHGEAIDCDLQWLGKVSNMHGNAVRAALRRLIRLGKIWEKDGKLMAKRCENELETARKRMRSATENGLKGGRPPKEISEVDEPTGSADLKTTNTNTNTNKKESPEPDGSSDSKKCATTPRDEMFETWWKGYPLKVGKIAARAKFDIALRKGATVEELAAGVELYKRTKPPDRDWVHPARWLYEGRWTDEVAPALVVDNTPTEQAEPTAEHRFRARMKQVLKPGGRWLALWGPPPDDPACEAPYDLLVEFGYRPATGQREGVG